jgi:hypothetical protein
MVALLRVFLTLLVSPFSRRADLRQRTWMLRQLDFAKERLVDPYMSMPTLSLPKTRFVRIDDEKPANDRVCRAGAVRH